MYIETMDKLFVKGYLTCALWSSTTDGGEPLNLKYDLDDFDEDTLKQLTVDAIKWFTNNIALLNRTPSTYNHESAGHDFWLTRNGHGAGFWDRGFGDIGELLTDSAQQQGEINLYIGDDDKLYAYGIGE